MRPLFLLALFPLLTGTALAQEAGPLAPAEGIVIMTEGEVVVRPDRAHLRAGVVTEGKTAEEALSRNRPVLARIIEAAKTGGLAPGDIRTSQVSLVPRMTQAQPGPGPRPPRAATIDGYEARAQITLTVRDIARTGPLIDALAAAGANDMGGISFAIADEDKPKDEARRKAAEAARARAELYTGALGVKLGPLVSIVETEADGGARPMGAPAYRMAAEAVATQVEPGEITVRASLRTVWRIGR